MYTVKTAHAYVEPLFCDLDAIELLTLARIFQSARDHVLSVMLQRLIPREIGVPLRDELISVGLDAYLSAVARCRSISSASETLIQMPMRMEWEEMKEPD